MTSSTGLLELLLDLVQLLHHRVIDQRRAGEVNDDAARSWRLQPLAQGQPVAEDGRVAARRGDVADRSLHAASSRSSDSGGTPLRK